MNLTDLSSLGSWLPIVSDRFPRFLFEIERSFTSDVLSFLYLGMIVSTSVCVFVERANEEA